MKTVTAHAVKSMLSDGAELAFFDVREHGQYGEGHPFFIVPAPYSRFEPTIDRLAPNRAVRMVLMDDGDGIAAKAHACAIAMGYTNAAVLEGGAPAWAAAGHTLYQGVNVPSKTFGELLELAAHTPRISAEDLVTMKAAGAKHVILDGRPFSEFEKFSIPGGACCPNGELALRISAIVPDADTTVVVNCAGRTRSILGTQTLIDAGVPNRVVALENGTQGWVLSGHELAKGETARFDVTAKPDADDPALAERQARARDLAAAAGVAFLTPEAVAARCARADRTTYLIDVRTEAEFAADGVAGATHAPGGQLVQATDQWIGVRNACVILYDSDGVRAPMVARWLKQMGHDASVADAGPEAIAGALPALASQTAQRAAFDQTPDLPRVAPADTHAITAGQLIDVRPSMAHRAAHIDGAIWSIRPRLSALSLETSRPVILIGDDATARLAASDLVARGATNIARLDGGPADWRAAGLTVVSTPDNPADADCIDHLFFTHDRHAGNHAAMRQYLEWEVGLVDQLDAQERGVFAI